MLRALPAPELPPRLAACTICRWTGPAFQGVAHSESAVCPGCCSIARDRYVFYCLTRHTPYRRERRLLKTSPRLPMAYRRAMRRRIDYLCSDHDLRAHLGDLRLDLQQIALPDDDLDVVVCAARVPRR